MFMLLNNDFHLLKKIKDCEIFQNSTDVCDSAISPLWQPQGNIIVSITMYKENETLYV